MSKHIEKMENINKSSVHTAMSRLPDQFTMEQLIDEVSFVNKVKTGINESNLNQTITKQEAEHKLLKWLK